MYLMMCFVDKIVQYVFLVNLAEPYLLEREIFCPKCFAVSLKQH